MTATSSTVDSRARAGVSITRLTQNCVAHRLREAVQFTTLSTRISLSDYQAR